jgi:hypothetical protein
VKFQKQAVFLITSPLSKRYFDRLGVKHWLGRCWKVSVLDFTKFLKPKFWNYVDGERLCIDFDGLTIVDNIDSALKIIENINCRSVFIDLIDYSNTEQKIRKAARTKGKTLELNVGACPIAVTPLHNRLQRNIIEALSQPSITFQKSIKYFAVRRKEPSDYMVVGGTITSNHKIVKGKPAIIKAHSRDYDYFLSDESFEVASTDQELVFLDVNVVWHSDFVHAGVKAVATEENYFPTMNAGLSQIADALGYSVKIASHPRADYENKPLKYSFPIFKDVTYDLIKHASVVVSHDTTALAWAVIMRKPIILVTTDELYSSFRDRLAIDKFADLLGINVVNLDDIGNIYDWGSHLIIDEVKYQKYIETYVKQQGSPEKLFWDIVIDRIESDL